MFISGKDVEVMSEKLNSDMENIRQSLCCNKLLLNVSKTHYMVFAPKSKHVDDLNVKIQNTKIERVSVTKFLGVMIDAQLSWKCHIEYTCKKISKCVGFILKARKKSVLLNLYYSFAYPYFIYCNHVWGNTCLTNLKKLLYCRKNLLELQHVLPIEHIVNHYLLPITYCLLVRKMYTWWVYSCTITVMIMCQIYQVASFREIENFMIEIQGNQMIFMYDLQGLM